jgi:hypothetical protein
VLRDRAGGGDLLLGCRLCRQLDVVTQRMRREEEEDSSKGTSTQPKTWVVPCRCPALVHRRCLEARVLGGNGGEGEKEKGGESQSRSGKPRGWISYDTALLEGGHGVSKSLLKHRLSGGDIDMEHLTRYPSQQHTIMQEGSTLAAAGALGLCARCGCLYTLGFRLPTLPELVAVTWQDECVLKWLLCVGWMD